MILIVFCMLKLSNALDKTTFSCDKYNRPCTQSILGIGLVSVDRYFPRAVTFIVENS